MRVALWHFHMHLSSYVYYSLIHLPLPSCHPSSSPASLSLVCFSFIYPASMLHGSHWSKYILKKRKRNDNALIYKVIVRYVTEWRGVCPVSFHFWRIDSTVSMEWSLENSAASSTRPAVVTANLIYCLAHSCSALFFFSKQCRLCCKGNVL